MELSPRSPEERYGPALLLAQQELKERDPTMIAEWAGVRYQAGAEGSGAFHVPFWDDTFTISFPQGLVTDGHGEEPHIWQRLVILHYLLHASGMPMADRWIAFRELPGGLGYDSVFQARVNRRLTRAFGDQLGTFKEAATALGGVPLSVGDAAFAFDLFPRLRVAVVIYEGDEEFSASANFIFDGHVDRYLPTEDLVVLGETVAGRLSKYQA